MYFLPHGPVTRSVYECLVFPRDRTVKQAREVFFYLFFEMWFLNFPAITRESLDARIELRLRIKEIVVALIFITILAGRLNFETRLLITYFLFLYLFSNLYTKENNYKL